MLCTTIWPAAGAAHGVDGKQASDLQGNDNAGEEPRSMVQSGAALALEFGPCTLTASASSDLELEHSVAASASLDLSISLPVPVGFSLEAPLPTRVK